MNKVYSLLQNLTALKHIILKFTTFDKVVRKCVQWLQKMRSVANVMHMIGNIVKVLFIFTHPTH